MALSRRKLIDDSFSGLGIFSILLMSASLVVLLAPMVVRGLGAFCFRATVEHLRVQFNEFGVGNAEDTAADVARAAVARKPAFDMLVDFETELTDDFVREMKYREPLDELKKSLRELLGPLPGDDRDKMPLPRQWYGQTRWQRALVKQHDVLYRTEWVFQTRDEMGKKTFVPRVDDFRGTPIEPLFAYVEDHLEEMMQPRWTLHWRFLTQESIDSHFFGGIWPELLGTFYLATGTMLFAVPVGVIAAIYLTEYAGRGRFISLLRTCISTLAGVPSIVFGLFGLAFFINGIHVSDNKSVLAGSLTLALLVLPTVIRASEEAIRAVPRTYKEAALSVGAGRWRTIVTVVLPAALPGILTGIIISMGRAAGETAPIIFTAAVSVGKPLSLFQTLNEGTPALSWNIYNLATEHEAIDEIRHVQYGMVFALVFLVLTMSLAAILVRARISKKLRG